MFQAFAIQMGVAWGLGMLNRAMAGRPPRPPKPRPEDVEFPLTKIGTPIPIVFGTIRIDSPVLVWADLYRATEEPGYPGLFRYSASCLFVLGVPPDRELEPAWSAPVLRRIWVADKKVSFPVTGGVLTHGNSVELSGPTAVSLGGVGNGGSFEGYLEFFDGRADQVITNFPSTSPVKRVDISFKASAAVDRSLVPGYRNQMLLACLCDTYTNGENATFGEVAQFPAIAAEVAVVDKDAINTVDANLAWVTYDLICARVFKLGYDSALVDTASFQTCATQLVIEQNGCSGKLDAEEDLEQLANALLAQADGVIDEDPATGLLSMRLIRSADASVMTLDVDNTIGRPRITQTGWLENANHVDVTFTNRGKAYKQDTVSANRLSNAFNQNYRHRPRTVNYPYCMTAENAGRLAARDAAVLCRPLMTCSATLSREAYLLRRGQVVIANWPQLSVTDKRFRVLDIDRGQLGDDAIRVNLVEDVFDNTFGAIEPDPGVVAGIDDLPILNRIFDEAPRWLVRTAFLQGLISDQTTPRTFAVGRREPEQSLAVSYAAQTSVAGDDDYSSDVIAQTFPTTAKVVTAYPYHLEPYDTSTGLVIEDVTGELAAAFEDPALLAASIFDGGLVATEDQVAGGANLIRINGEMLAYESVTDLGGGQYRLNNVWRGLHDSTADDHALGDVVYWLDYDNVGTQAWTYGDDIDGQSIGVPVEPGNFDPATDTITIRGASFGTSFSRIELPYRGADLSARSLELVSGTAGVPAVTDYYKRISDYDGALDLVWRQRSEAATSVVRGDDATAYAVQAEATWRVFARKVGEDELDISGSLPEASDSSDALLLGAAGHGEIDVLLRTVSHKTIGLSTFNTGNAWQDARVRVTAHRARNLLANGGAEYGDMTSWSTPSGSSSVSTGVTSLEQRAGAHYFRITGVAA